MPAALTEGAADAALDQVLVALAGPDAVAKDDQRTAVRAVAVGGGRVLVVQATGWGSRRSTSRRPSHSAARAPVRPWWCPR